MKKFLIDFIITFSAIFIVVAIVTYIWEGAFNWETVFRFAISLGIAIPLANVLRRKKQ